MKGEAIKDELFKILSTDVPYGAEVTLSDFELGNGFVTPPLPEKLRASLDCASEGVFGKKAVF